MFYIHLLLGLVGVAMFLLGGYWGFASLVSASLSGGDSHAFEHPQMYGDPDDPMTRVLVAEAATDPKPDLETAAFFGVVALVGFLLTAWETYRFLF